MKRWDFEALIVKGHIGRGTWVGNRRDVYVCLGGSGSRIFQSGAVAAVVDASLITIIANVYCHIYVVVVVSLVHVIVFVPLNRLSSLIVFVSVTTRRF